MPARLNTMTNTEYCEKCDREVMPIDKRPGEFKCPTHGWVQGLSAGFHQSNDDTKFWNAPLDERTRDATLTVDGKKIGDVSDIKLSIESALERYAEDTYERSKKQTPTTHKKWTPREMALRIQTLKKQLERMYDNERWFK